MLPRFFERGASRRPQGLDRRRVAIGATILIAVACDQRSPIQPDTISQSGASAPSSSLAVRLPGSEQGGRPIITALTGADEIPGPGDPDGTGTVHITLNDGQGEVCFELTVENIEAATAAHIHEAPVGVAGPVVIPLTAPTSGSSNGCLSVDRELVKDIMQTPADYYVNVHNAAFPAGAIRGQLSK